MNRKGHVGMALLAFAPVAYVLISEGKFAIALLGWIGIHAVEPLPDQDFHLPFLTHRGLSHSLLAVLVVGVVLGAVGWLLGDRLFEWLYALLSVGGELWGWVLSRLPDLLATLLSRMIPNIPPEAIVSTLKQQAGGSVSRRGFAMFGFFVGAYGIFTHLLGDVITTRGIKPLQPLSNWQLSLSSLRADSPVANSSLFFLGVLAVVVVLGATVPGMILGASAPATLSPVGVASAQDASPRAHNGSVAINETASTRSLIILKSVTLPKHGYIVARTGGLSANQSSTEVVGHTAFVQNGSFQGVILALNESVAKGASVVVTLHNDTNGNETWDGIKTDSAYVNANGAPIHDSVKLGTKEKENSTTRDTPSNQTASVELDSTNNTTAQTVVVSKVTLPEGGFVVIHGPEFAEQGMLDGSQIVASRYLKPGTHRNVSIPVKRGVPGAYSNTSRINLTRTKLSAIVYRDTNNNTHYDFVGSLGQNDTPYRKGYLPINDTETVVFEQNVKLVRERTQVEPVPIQFTDQRVRVVSGSPAVVVENVTLPKGGFVVIHDSRYLPPSRNPLDSALGHSQYLKPGTHRNVVIQLSSGSITESQTLVAVPYLDTDDDRRYDYVTTGGVDDYQYIAQQNGSTVVPNDTARVSPSAQIPTTSTPAPMLTTVSSSPPSLSPTTATTAGTPTTPQSPANPGVLASLPIWLKGALLVVIVMIGLALLGRWT